VTTSCVRLAWSAGLPSLELSLNLSFLAPPQSADEPLPEAARSTAARCGGLKAARLGTPRLRPVAMAETIPAVNTGAPDDIEAPDEQERPETTAAADTLPDAAAVDGDGDGDDDEEENSEQSDLPFPSFASKAFYLLDQTMVPRRWCLQLVTSPYPFHRLFSHKRL